MVSSLHTPIDTLGGLIIGILVHNGPLLRCHGINRYIGTGIGNKILHGRSNMTMVSSLCGKPDQRYFIKLKGMNNNCDMIFLS
jgi:hypothetical protein